jgi:hypothetical protein
MPLAERTLASGSEIRWGVETTHFLLCISYAPVFHLIYFQYRSKTRPYDRARTPISSCAGTFATGASLRRAVPLFALI